MPTATRLRALLTRMVMAIVTNLVPTLFVVVGGLYLLLGIAELVGATEWFFNEPAGTSITFADLLLPLLGVALVGIAVGLKQRRRDIWLLSVGMIAGFTFVSWAPLSAVSRDGGGGMDVVALITNLALVGSLLSTRNRYTVRGSNLMRASVYLGWLASLAVISGVYWGVSMLVLDVTWDQARTYSLGDPTSTIDNLQRLQLLATIAFFVACLAFLIRLLKSLRPDDVRLSVAATRDLLRRCGADSLDYFVTNEKKRHYIWRDGRGLIGYDLANGLVLASGNPICAPQHRATLLNDFLHDMERDGYVVAFWAIDQTLADDLGNRGFRTVKLGEEASLEVDRFSLENLGARGSALKRAVRSVEAHGIEFAFYRLEEVPGHVYSQMDDLDRSWLQEFGGTDEKGFSMTLSRLPDFEDQDAAFAVALDPSVPGLPRVVAYLSFVPVYNRNSYSLDMMRRTRQAPNGINDFLLVHTLQVIGYHGRDTVSLNFAPLAETAGGPSLLGRAANALPPSLKKTFYIDSLYAYNDRFGPDWVPRYGAFKARRDLIAIVRMVAKLEGAIALDWRRRLSRLIAGSNYTITRSPPVATRYAPEVTDDQDS